ncbi:hypothetical protein GCM10022259_31400 [Aquimarina mytili]
MYLLIIVNIFELLAALVGSYTMKKYRVRKLTRYFVYFLWLTVFVELIFGWIPWFVYKIDSISHLKQTFLGNNHWAYNVYFIISFLFYIFFFKENIHSKKIKLFLSVLMFLYVIASTSNLIFTNVFFEGTSPVTYIFGAILIFLSVMLYFYEILKSDTILSFHKSLPFYIAIGAMVFHLIVTPLFIYIQYNSVQNPDFVQVRKIILNSANIFLYTCYTIGFIVCSKKNRSY